MVAAMQREMPFLESLQKSSWVAESIVTGWETYRDAVIWCWQNRRRNSRDEIGDQAMFARSSGVHRPHVSRMLNPRTKAPMDLPPDQLPSFEAFTGWRGVTQYMAHIGRTTVMEQVIAERNVA
ncbi:hypothetical protein [Methyloversatilis discipulorum]|uniref:hypothetical protein n=1 Tax=Methyloversatilis discipulorum TaxID=1119528 RepID=UPI000381E1F1|nr:hypothetical protein [Methyloversatilis discipulorum]